MGIGSGKRRKKYLIPPATYCSIRSMHCLRCTRNGAGQGLPVIAGRYARGLGAVGNNAVKMALVLGYDYPGVVGYLYLS